MAARGGTWRLPTDLEPPRDPRPVVVYVKGLHDIANKRVATPGYHTQLSRTRPRRVSGPSRGDARPGAAYPREGPVANAFRSGEIYVPPTKSSGALWASCAAVVLRAHAHKRSRSNGAGMLHAVMCPSGTAHTVVVAKETRAFPTMFF